MENLLHISLMRNISDLNHIININYDNFKYEQSRPVKLT